MNAEVATHEPFSPRSEVGPYRSAQYFELPDEPRYELLFGRLHMAPSPSSRHQRVVLLLSEIFLRAARQSGGKVLTAPIDVVISDHSVVQPDLLYVSGGRRSIIQDRVVGVPDLIVEVISHGTARRDRGEKLRLYADAGVKEYWLVDPVNRYIDFLIGHEGAFEVILAEDDRYRSPLFPEIHIHLADFWQEIDGMEL